MKHLHTTSLARAAIILAVAIVSPNVFGLEAPRVQDEQEATQRAQQQETLQQILSDRASYAAAIVRRWEDSARASDRWDSNYSVDLQKALMNLQPENLLAAGEASSYKAMMRVLATGRTEQTIQTRAQLALGNIVPLVLGDYSDDLVYSPVTPCRIVDTRFGGGALNGTRSFDVDGSNFTAQGGSATGCGIPYGVASAVAMTITVTGTLGGGYVTVWQLLAAQPLSSVLNYATGENIANTTIVPVLSGAGVDFNLYSSNTTDVVIDVAGYFSPPVATALDCTTVTSAVTAVAVNSWTAIDANCPAGRTATGGGYNTPEGTGGYPGVWLTSMPSGNGWRTWVDNQTSGTRSIQTFCKCCRVPGR